MNPSLVLTELVAVGGILIVALLLALARRRVSSPTERIKLRAAAWSLLSETPTHANDNQEKESGKRNA